MAEQTTEEKPKWIKLKAKEIESMIIDLGKQKMSSAKIGIILRDKHGIPKVKEILNKRISQILEENEIIDSSEKDSVTNKIESIKKHISKNKHDFTASKALTKKLWTLRRYS